MVETGPLHGLRIIEVSGGIAAAACCRVLRGFGAETVRIDIGHDQLTTDELTFFTTGSVPVDWSTTDLVQLVAGADVLVEDQRPGWLAANGLDPEQLAQTHPDLVITSISPFGQTGPQATWQTTNAVQFAAGGLMSLTGEPHRPPLVTGGDQAFMLAGLHAMAATAMAVLRAGRTGHGDWIDLSMQECAASMTELYGPMSEYDTKVPVVRAGNSVRSTWGVYRCADGFAGVCCLERQIPALFKLLGEPVASEPNFADAVIRAEHDDELLAHLMGFMIDKTKEELLELSPRLRVPFGAVRTPAELLTDATHIDRDFFDSVAIDGHQITMPGRPFPGLSWTTPMDQSAAGPPGWEARPVAAPEAPIARPLAGTRVLDLTAFWAGPYATKLMAENGAEVVKIESPAAWDNIRTLVPQDASIPDPWNSAYYFNEYNHSKSSVTLDLAQDEGRKLFLRLVAEADVVIENYRADVLDTLGLGYEVLREAKEDIILVSMAGFGKTGALKNHVGFGPIIEMMSGLMSLTGYGGDEDVPYKTGISYGDPVGGLHANLAVSLALRQRDLTGHGRHIDLAQRETAAAMCGPAFVAASLTGEDPTHWGNRHPRFAPQGCYPAAGDDRWLVVSVRDDSEWAVLCELLDQPDLAGLSAEERRIRHDQLDELISSWTADRSAAELQTILQSAGVPAAAVVNTLDLYDDPQLVHRGFHQVVPNPKMHAYRQSGPTWKFRHSPTHQMTRSPWFGEHNDSYLKNGLGLSEVEMDRLTEQNVIGTEPINPVVG